jgi:hypothetical protein
MDPMRSIRHITLLAVLLAASPSLSAPLTVHYTTRWAGLPAGEIDMRFDDGPDAYRSQIDIRTAGLPNWLSRFRARAISEGGIAVLGLATPGRYDATYDLRKRKDKRISLRFRQSGEATIAERGPEDSSDKPPIAAGDRTGVVDPLAAFTRMRQAIRSGLAQRGGFKIAVYDGKRRFDVDQRALTAETRLIAGEWRRVLHLDLVLRPIAGFKDNDPEGNPDDSSRALDVFFSDDEALIPLMLEAKVAWLTMVVEYAGRCEGPGSPCKGAFE